jgi:sugar-specific transcriptional regulator TrmB
MAGNNTLQEEIDLLRGEIEQLKIEKEEKEEERIIRALQWLNMGEAKAKAYIYLVKKGKATAEQVAKGADLYPTTAREVLTKMAESHIVNREKMETNGAGRKPFLYTAIPPSELIRRRAHEIEQRLSEVLRLEFLRKDGEIKFKTPLLPIQIEIKNTRKESQNPSE